MSMPPAQFEAVIRMRGYTLTEVAARWGLTPARLTQIKSDPLRPARYEDAIWGLPDKKTAAATTARRDRIARNLVGDFAPEPKRRARPRAPATAALMLTEVGDIWVVKDSPGEHLPEGCEGHVTAIERHGSSTQVSFLFANGYTEAFDQNFVLGRDCFLAATGKTWRAK